jgi:hypothetical protein
VIRLARHAYLWSIAFSSVEERMGLVIEADVGVVVML